MLGLTLQLHGDGAYPDLLGRPPGDVIHLGNDAPPIGVAALAGGRLRATPRR